MIHIPGVLLGCPELGVDVRGSRMRLGRLEIQRATADCILGGGEVKTQHLQLFIPVALLPRQCTLRQYHVSSSILNGFPSLKVGACLFAKYHN